MSAFRHRRRSGWVALLATGAFGGLFALVKANRSEAFDLAMTLRIQGARHPALDRTMAAVSWPGFPPQSRMIPPLVIATWLASGRPRAAWFQTLAWAPAILSSVLKVLVRRPRPVPPAVRVVVAPLGGTSFPSGHVLTYMGFYGSLAYLLSVEARPSLARDVVIVGLLGLLALIGPSRVQRGHHWTTDVVASYLVGTAYLAATIALYERAPA